MKPANIRLILSFVLLLTGLAGYSQTSKSNKPEALTVSLEVVQKDSIRITVKNTGKRTVAAYSHVICRENQYDYFEMEAITPDKKELLFSFYDDRPTYAPVLTMLGAGESFSHTISISNWSERLVNTAALKNAGLSSLPRGTKIRAKYYSVEADSFNGFMWTGTVYSDWITY